jgi:hypothetical protein
MVHSVSVVRAATREVLPVKNLPTGAALVRLVLSGTWAPPSAVPTLKQQERKDRKMARKKRDYAAEWQRTAEKARALRGEMRAKLGNRCQWYEGKKDQCTRTKNLEFDHPQGRSWQPRRTNMMVRMRLYRMALESGKLRLLCRPHNAIDGQRRQKELALLKPRDPQGGETKRAERNVPRLKRAGRFVRPADRRMVLAKLKRERKARAVRR